MYRPATIKYLQFKKVTEPLDKMELLFKDAFEEHFENAKVELIRFREPRVFEDPDYLKIDYVYSSSDRLGSKNVMNFIRLMHSKLSEINEERFPVLSFIEYNDYLENTPKELLV